MATRVMESRSPLFGVDSSSSRPGFPSGDFAALWPEDRLPSACVRRDWAEGGELGVLVAEAEVRDLFGLRVIDDGDD